MRPRYWYLACLILAACFTHAAVGGLDRIQIIAHRASADGAPENTLPAIKRSIELGFDIVEVDVRVTRDGRLILLHDATLGRTTNGVGAVSKLTYPEILQFDAGIKFSSAFAGTRVPLLEEAILLAQDKIVLYLDIKVPEYGRITELVRKHGFSESTYYRPYTLQGAEHLRQLDPDARIIMPLAPVMSRKEMLDTLFDRYPGVVLSADLGQLQPEVISSLRRRGIPVFINVLGEKDSVENLRKAVEWGPSGIQTDHPDRLQEILRLGTVKQ